MITEKIRTMEPIVEVKQNSVILMWNPTISSYTMERFESDLKIFMPVGWMMTLIGAYGNTKKQKKVINSLW